MIYPVKFESFWAKSHRDFVNMVLKDKYLCANCRKRLNYGFWAYHAAPYGYAWGEFWCSNKCQNEWWKKDPKKRKMSTPMMTKENRKFEQKMKVLMKGI